MKNVFKSILVSLPLGFILFAISNTAFAGKWFPTNKINCQIWNANPQTNETANWSGKCLNGKANGYGILLWSGGSKYIGKYSKGYMDGIGKLTWGNEEKKSVGDFYIGEFKKDFMHGEGVYTFSSGKVDEGIWNRGRLVKKKKVKDLQKRFAKIKKLIFEPNLSLQPDTQ